MRATHHDVADVGEATVLYDIESDAVVRKRMRVLRFLAERGSQGPRIQSFVSGRARFSGTNCEVKTAPWSNPPLPTRRAAPQPGIQRRLPRGRFEFEMCCSIPLFCWDCLGYTSIGCAIEVIIPPATAAGMRPIVSCAATRVSVLDGDVDRHDRVPDGLNRGSTARSARLSGRRFAE